MGRLCSLDWRKGAIICVGLVALATLTGCSALKLGYGQLPTLAYWWLDGYVDFDDAQALRVKNELQRWTEWHRRTQLPVYAEHLARVRSEASQAVTGERLCRLNDATRELLGPAIERMLPAASAMVLTLRPEQVQNIDARYRKRTAEMREDMLQPDLQERLKASVERSVERFETFYGNLGEHQRRIVEEGLRASPFDAQVWLAQRDGRHRDMLDALRSIVREQPPAQEVQQRLSLLARRFDGRAPLASPQQAAALSAYNCELAARVHNSASPTQRRHLADKLRGWEDDLRTLAARDSTLAARAEAEPVRR